MPGAAVPRKAELESGAEPPSWLRRLWVELAREAGEHDRFIRLIILERLVKSTLLILAAISFIVTGRVGLLGFWLAELRQDLNLDLGGNLIERLLAAALAWLLQIPHQTLFALGIILYAALEGTEGIGLWLRRRWAEYLTVIATGLLIPYEVFEVYRRQTPFRIGGLLLNLAVVVYLAWRKRLFVGI